jgi:natural product biosynthesis luciferase-like monooxygenase protein
MNPYTKDKPTDVSLFFFAATEDRNTDEKIYELLLKGSKFADANGLKGIWIPERHFSTFGDIFPNPAVCASAVAATTKNLRIRSGSVVLPLRDPINVAEDWSVVDNLSGGRVELAVAPGWHPTDFVLAPQNFDRRHEAMRDSLETLTTLWEGRAINRNDGKGVPADVITYPRPIQSKLPVWITAAKAEEAFRYAGSIGANVLTNLLLQPKEDLKAKIDIYYESLIENGFSVEDGNVAIMIHAFMSEDPKFTEQMVKAPFKAYLEHFVDLLKPIADEAGVDAGKARKILAEMGFNRYFHTGGLFGSLENCLERVDELKDYGVNEVACLIDFGIDTKSTLEHLPNLAKLQNEIRARG